MSVSSRRNPSPTGEEDVNYAAASPRAPVSPTKLKNKKNKKSKIISIRISHEDYELLKSKHAASGRRSISALAREAMQRIFQNNLPGDDVVEGLRHLDAKLHLLQAEVTHLSRLAARVPVADKKGEADG